MATRRSEWLASIKPILDRDEAKKDAKALAKELGDILEVKVDADPSSLGYLANEFNAQLKAMGKQPVVFSEKTVRGIVSQFANAIAEGFSQGIESVDIRKELDKLNKRRESVAKQYEQAQRVMERRTKYNRLENFNINTAQTFKVDDNIEANAKKTVQSIYDAAKAIGDAKKLYGKESDEYIDAVLNGQEAYTKYLRMQKTFSEKLTVAQRLGMSSGVSALFDRRNAKNEELEWFAADNILDHFEELSDVINVSAGGVNKLKQELAQIDNEIAKITQAMNGAGDGVVEKTENGLRTLDEIQKKYEKFKKKGKNEIRLQDQPKKHIEKATKYVPKENDGIKVFAQEYRDLATSDDWVEKYSALVRYVKLYESYLATDNKTHRNKVTDPKDPYGFTELYKELKPMAENAQNMLQNILNLGEGKPLVGMGGAEKEKTQDTHTDVASAEKTAEATKTTADEEARAREEAEKKRLADEASVAANHDAADEAERERRAKEASVKAEEERQRLLKNKDAIATMHDTRGEAGAFFNSETGEFSDVIAGGDHSVETERSAWEKASEAFDTRIHKHNYDVAAPSFSGEDNDFAVWIKGFDIFKKQMILANKEILSFDFSSLESVDTLREIARKYREGATEIDAEFNDYFDLASGGPSRFKKKYGIEGTSKNMNEQLQVELRKVIDRVMEGYQGIMTSISLPTDMIKDSSGPKISAEKAEELRRDSIERYANAKALQAQANAQRELNDAEAEGQKLSLEEKYDASSDDVKKKYQELVALQDKIIEMEANPDNGRGDDQAAVLDRLRTVYDEAAELDGELYDNFSGADNDTRSNFFEHIRQDALAAKPAVEAVGDAIEETNKSTIDGFRLITRLKQQYTSSGSFNAMGEVTEFDMDDINSLLHSFGSNGLRGKQTLSRDGVTAQDIINDLPSIIDSETLARAFKLLQGDVFKLGDVFVDYYNDVISYQEAFGRIQEVVNEHLTKLSQIDVDENNDKHAPVDKDGVGDTSSVEPVVADKTEALQDEIEQKNKELAVKDDEIARIQAESEAEKRALGDEKATLQNDLDQTRQQLADTEYEKGLYDSAMNQLAEELNEKDRIIYDLREQLANVKTGGGEAHASVDSEELKNVLSSIVYNVKITHDDNDKTANKIALDDSTLEATLTKVFANILNPQTQQNDSEQKQAPWALESTLQTVKGVLENMQTNASKIGTAGTSNVDKIAGTALDGRLIEIKTVLDSINSKIAKGRTIITKDAVKAARAKAKEETPKTHTGRATSINSVVKDYESLGKLRAQFEKDRNLETKARLKNLAAEVKHKRESLNLTTDEILALREKSKLAYEAEQRLIDAARAQKEIDDQRKAAANDAKQQAKDAETAWKKQVKDAQRATGINAAISAANAGDQTVVRAIGTEGISKDIEDKAKDLADQIKALRALRDEIDKKGDQASDEDRDVLSKQIAKVKELKTEVDGYLKIHEKYSGEGATQFDGVDTSNFGAVGTDQYWNNITAAIKNASDGRVTIKGMNADTGELTGTTKIAANTFATWSATVDPITGKLSMLRTGIKKTETIIEQITRKTKEIFTYFSGSSIIFKAINELKRGVQYVRDIDLALTELKKVTDETEEAYDEFLKTAAKTGSRLGATISAVTEATATFAKLGYSMEQATEMAEAAIVYKNVGDNIASTEDAADSIISTMKGFGLEASESMAIVDRFNEVGNRFAITSQGIGEALRLSASALNEGGNSLDESIAMITAANEVVGFMPRSHSNMVTRSDLKRGNS